MSNHYSCTYSADDDKLRLSALHRLDEETYKRVKALGFGWAPKQQVFYAVWGPEREDLMLELCGEIDDEDTSLVERAEARAERFEDYSEKREAEAQSARKAVDRIADGIPMGQPILVGHHSERHARRDAKRIEDGMRKSIKLWETSKYWTDRAAGAIAAAKYKELPGVRHRRIKGLESERRKCVKNRETSLAVIKLWGKEGLTVEQGIAIANFDHGVGFSLHNALTGWPSGEPTMTIEQAVEAALKAHTRTCERCERWISHIDNRLAYERAMLGEQGGLAADKFDIKTGGRVFLRGRRAGEWFVVRSVNKGAEGRVNSVSVFGIGWTVGIESVADYRDPSAEDVAKVKKATALAPIVNYRGEGFREMTKAEWDRYSKSGSGCMRKNAATDKHGAHRQREAFAGGGSFRTVNVYVSDMPTKELPAPVAAEPVHFEREVVLPDAPPPVPKPAPEPTVFDAMKETLKVGVKVVVNPDLFPTPKDLAWSMARIADVAGRSVLEPSAGTGALVDACAALGANVHALETSIECRAVLARAGHCAVLTTGPSAAESDFDTFECGPPCYERIVMNPPFGEKRDVAHVRKAYESCLAPGGRLVAVMAAGIRFREDSATRELRALIERVGYIEDLPADSFKSAGTSVRTCLVVLDKPRAQAPVQPQQQQQLSFA